VVQSLHDLTGAVRYRRAATHRLTTRIEHIMSISTRHYTRRVSLVDQIRDRALYFGAGVATSSVGFLALTIYQNFS
jgi:hypothetical protein